MLEASPTPIHLQPAHRALLLALLARHLPGVTVRVFGSRVADWPASRGVKPYSDLDLAVTGRPADLALAALRADGTDEPQAAETDDPAHRDSTAEAQGAATPAESTESTEPAGDDPAVEPDGPATLPGYDAMTLAQVRGHLRELSVADVTDLLAYEQAGENRAPFLTLLSNRLVTLGAQES